MRDPPCYLYKAGRSGAYITEADLMHGRVPPQTVKCTAVRLGM